MRLIIFGPPGAGKGTYATRLGHELGITVVSTGDIFRQEVRRNTNLGRKAAEFLSRGELVPDQIVTGILAKKIHADDAMHGFILDGYPRTIEQARALDKMVKIDAVIRLTVPERIIVERLSNRRVCKKCGAIFNLKYLKPKEPGVCDNCGGELFQRGDDVPQVIRERLRIYETQTQPLIEYYKDELPILNIKCSSARIPPEIIVREILRKLQKANLPV